MNGAREYLRAFPSARCAVGKHDECTKVAHMGAFPNRRRPCDCDCHEGDKE
jgi:hypothetical protein